ncbi:nucleoside diphosphate kinase homolog 5-like isoform X2 [Rhodnius prolixus]
MIKPCALRFASEIVNRIQNEGFTILKSRKLHVSPEMISEFFFEHYGKAWFPKMVIKLSKSPLMVMVLAKDHAIKDFKELMGPPRVSIARRVAPYSLRAMYGLKGDFATNGIHGSDNREKVLREIHFFFPQGIPEPLSTTLESMDSYKDQFHFMLIKSLGDLYKYKSPDLLMWFTRWLEKKNPEIPKIKVTYPHDIVEEEKAQQIVAKRNKCAIFS